MSVEEYILWFIKYYATPMIANAMPVLIKQGKPIDNYRVWIDGKRVLGDGKTWEGFITGLIGGYLASIVISTLLQQPFLVPLLFLAALFGLLGDIVESFFKRRLGLKRGDPLPIMDQLDFALSTTLFYYIIGAIDINKTSLVILALIIIALTHIISNTIAYILGLKKHPW